MKVSSLVQYVTIFPKGPCNRTHFKKGSEKSLLCIKDLFIYLGFMARQDYFTHFEPSQSKGWAKTGDPREKPPDHPQTELCLSHM